MSACGEAEPIVAIVSFFGTGGLLGSKTFSADGLVNGGLFGGGGLFAGFDDPTGLITGVRINDIFEDPAVIAVDDLEVEAPVPAPPPFHSSPLALA